MIAAAGSGERLGAGGPKAFVQLAGRPMVKWSITAFEAVAAVSAIVVACPPGHARGLGGESSAGQGAAGLADGDLRVVDGGRTRSESVANALAAVETELVAIHDAARPLVTPELIEAVISTLQADTAAAGAIAATRVTDTIKRAVAWESAAGPASGSRLMHQAPYRGPNASSVVEGTVDRGRLWAAQTPQVFRVEALRRALEADPERVEAATDEAMLVEAAGGRVLIQPAPAKNLKVTTQLDLRLAEILLAERC